ACAGAFESHSGLGAGDRATEPARRAAERARAVEGGDADELRVLHRPRLTDCAAVGPERRATFRATGIPVEPAIHGRREAGARLRCRHEPYTRGRPGRARCQTARAPG